jgi:predicted Zn-dependent protease with MMP-like domain
MSSPVTSGSAAAWGRYLDHHDRDVIARRTADRDHVSGQDADIHANQLKPVTPARWSAKRTRCRTSAAVHNGLVIEVEPGRFEEMVVEALDGLPPELGRLMRNVAVTVEHNPGPRGLLGLYEGIPLTSRTSQYAGVLPDRITIYRQAICAICRTEAEVADQVRRTVIHEIAHHFGIDDDRLRELGWLSTARWLLLAP